MSPVMKRHRKNRGVPPPATFSIDTLPGSSNLTALEVAAIIRRTPGALEQWRRDPNHPLKWRYVVGARSVAPTRCATIWLGAITLLRSLNRIVLAETTKQLGLDRVERIRPPQAHDLADPYRADQLCDVVMSRFVHAASKVMRSSMMCFCHSIWSARCGAEYAVLFSRSAVVSYSGLSITWIDTARQDRSGCRRFR